MRTLSNTTRSDSLSKTPSDTGDIAEAFTGKDYYQELIERANTVPLIKVFRYYGVVVSELQHTIRCPFKSHKGGRESTGSFKYYHETNSFCCFGCHTGGQFAHAAHFVAAMDGISVAKAAVKILDVFRDSIGDIDDDSFVSPSDFAERMEIMMDFSNTVREFYQTYLTENARVYVEGACKKYDALNLKHQKLDNEALRRIVEQLKDYINLYKP